MSRVSISKRMAAIEAALRKSDPFGCAVHYLAPPLRKSYDEWVAECERITGQHDNAYSAWLNGNCAFPRMPTAVANVIDSRLSKGTIHADCTENDARDIYNALLGENY